MNEHTVYNLQNYIAPVCHLFMYKNDSHTGLKRKVNCGSSH